MEELNARVVASQVAAASARGAVAGLIRVVLAMLVALVVNGLCAVATIVVNPHVMGGGHGSLIVIGVLLLPPFVLGTIVVGVLAFKQALQGVTARLVESQAGNLAVVGGQVLEIFLQKTNYQTGRYDVALGRQWQDFLRAQAQIPQVLVSLLNKLAKRAPVARILAEAAAPGMTLSQLAHAAIGRMIETGARGGLRPSIKLLAFALVADIAAWIIYCVFLAFALA
jgi:hypothetical protein